VSVSFRAASESCKVPRRNADLTNGVQYADHRLEVTDVKHRELELDEAEMPHAVRYLLATCTARAGLIAYALYERKKIITARGWSANEIERTRRGSRTP
jgi:hypothetical protein